MNLPLPVRVDLLANVDGYAVDCRLLFMGDRLRQIVRTYNEVVHRFKRLKDTKRLFANLESSDEIKQFYEIQQANGLTSVLLRPAFFSERAALNDLEIEVEFKLDKKSFKHPLPLSKIRSLGHLLPLLRADLDRGQILSALNSTLAAEECEWAMRLCSLLQERGFLVDSKLPTNHFETFSVLPRITFLGHSSLLFQSAKAAVVTDTCLRMQYRMPPRAMDVARLKLNAICISHSHWDHCDLQSLLWFDKSTPVIVPRVRRPTVFNPPIVQAMQTIGFVNIREVDLWESVQIEDIELIPVPFHGEQDEPDAEIDHFTYVLRTRNLTVYGGVDSYRDTFGDMRPVLERIRDEYHPDVAFLPVSKMIYRYEWGGVNGFCRYLDTTLVDQDFQYTASGEDAAQWVAALQPRWVAPYATFNFWPWSAPPEVSQFAAALRSAGLEKRLYPFRPFDSLDSAGISDSSSQEFRRRMLVNWFRFGSRVRTYDRRMQQNRLYRYLRRKFA